jgi:hypothetical protein
MELQQVRVIPRRARIGSEPPLPKRKAAPDRWRSWGAGGKPPGRRSHNGWDRFLGAPPRRKPDSIGSLPGTDYRHLMAFLICPWLESMVKDDQPIRLMTLGSVPSMACTGCMRPASTAATRTSRPREPAGVDCHLQVVVIGIGKMRIIRLL